MKDFVAPSTAAMKKGTLKAFDGRIESDTLKPLLATIEKGLTASSQRATGSIKIIGIWGVVKCETSGDEHVFEGECWGVGLGAFEALGVLYYVTSWDDLWKNTKRFHAQGAAVEGGIFQITFLDDNSSPIGQFTAAAAGIGAYECGGKGEWKK
jgi:hypothetical protein